MDGIAQFVVDILRRGKENRALNKGGPVAGTREAEALLRQSRPTERQYRGRGLDDIVTEMERGR